MGPIMAGRGRAGDGTVFTPAYQAGSKWLLLLPLAGRLGFIPPSLRLGVLSPYYPHPPGLFHALGSLLRGAPVPPVTTHLPPVLVQELWWTLPAPPTPTEGRGRGHAVTFPFNSLVGPPVVERWGARAPATQSPWPPTPEPRVGGWTAPSWGLDKPIHFPSLSGSGEAVPTLITWWLKKKITRSGWQGGEARPGHGIPPPATPYPPPVAPNKYLQGTPGLVALAGVGVRQAYFRQRSK